MKYILVVIIGLALLISPQLYAQKGHQHNGHKHNKSHTHGSGKKAHNHRYSRSRVVVVKHRRVNKVNKLPAGYRTYNLNGRKYYRHNGYYYHYVGGTYSIISSPRGLRVTVLPKGYRKVVIRNKPHFYYRGTYYVQAGKEYEVVEPKEGTVVSELPEYNVEEITIDEKTYFEIDNILYQPVSTEEGSQYKIVGKLED